MNWLSALPLVLAAVGSVISPCFGDGPGPPGYRPASDRAGTFLKGVGKTSIAVFPTVVRSKAGTSYDRTSQGKIVRFIEDNRLAHAVSSERDLNPGELQGRFQWDVFQSGMGALGKQIVKEKPQSDYVLIVEVLITPTRSKGLAVGGIHCYLLDREGVNAFSFLLNSHHRMFQDAALKTPDGSAKGEGELKSEAVRTALKAFKQQVAEARK